MRERIIIHDQKVAAAFASSQQRKILQTLMGEELSLVALGARTETPLSLLHYHVMKLIKLGLINVVREVSRAGRAIKVYSASAHSYFVPAELLSELPGTALARQLRQALDRSLNRSLDGIEFTHDGRSHRAHLLKDPNPASTAIELWLDVGLSAADAEQLTADMQALIDHYRARGNINEPRLLVHVAAAKL